MTIPLVDLRAQYQALKPEIEARLQSVLGRAAFTMGSEHDEFERAFAAYLGGGQCSGVSSGTDALELALLACGLGPGDEVITVPHTFIATVEAISHAGARVRWVDVDARTYNMDPTAIEAAITPQAKAVIPVHLYGQPADMAPILDIARRHGLRVIEDCAQAHGARYRGQRVGTLGDVACFSFYPSKNLGAYGDAGAVVTADERIAEQVRLLRNHGQATKNVHQIEGYCRRLDNLQAAVLLAKLPHLDEWNERRRQAAAHYDRLLQELPAVIRPYVPPGVEPVYHIYAVQVPERDRVRAALAAEGIESGIHYPLPLHQQPAYAHLCCRPEDYPVSAALGRRILSLPIYPEITPAQIEAVVAALGRALAASPAAEEAR